MALQERTTYIYYPPEATDTEPVGRVDVRQGLGGWVIAAELYSGISTAKTIGYNALFLETRVNRLDKAMVSQAQFQANLIYDLPTASDMAVT